MTETSKILNQLLLNPDTRIDRQWVMGLLQNHPCFYLPAALLLKRNSDNLDKATVQRLQCVVMMNCADRTSIIDFVDPYKSGWDTFYPKEERIKTETDQTIDDFIQKFGKNSTPEEDALLERLIFNPVPADYFGGTDKPFDEKDPLALPPELKKNDNEKRSMPQHNEKIEPDKNPPHPEPANAEKLSSEAPPAPIVKPEAPVAPPHPDNTESANEESLLTESLVKIFIKRHNYERALDIISRLSLNYPEKSVYFADQKRFLKKLIINQQYMNQKK